MAEYHVGCGITGIFAGTWATNKNTKDGWHTWRNKSDVTTEAIHAVMLHLLPDDEYGVKSVVSRHNNGKLVRLSCEYVDENEVDEYD